MPHSDMLLNWRNTLQRTTDGAKYVAAQTALNYRASGYSADETIDLMVGEYFDVDLAKEVVAQVYGESKTNISQGQTPRIAMVAPTSYNDVVPFVEGALTKLSPSQFADVILNDLLVASDRDKDGWRRLAQQAVHDPIAKNILHEDLRPWVEEAMLNAVLLAEKNQARVVEADAASRKYIVATNNHTFEVNLTEGTCTCDAFNRGNFGVLGLACEHIVRAADTVSPFQRLTRALREK